jgi:hypothetical protein
VFHDRRRFIRRSELAHPERMRHVFPDAGDWGRGNLALNGTMLG